MGATVSFQNKHVLITGGSEGIGFSLADGFLSEGARVTILSRSADKLAKAMAQLQEKHSDGTIHTVTADVSDFNALQSALDRLEDEHGAVDVVVCSAGLSIPAEFVDQRVADAQKVMNVNYLGSYYTAKALVPKMIARKSGHISFISSMAAVCPIAGYTSYAPTKAAVRALADALRSELQGTGVSVSISYPPDTETPGFAVESQTVPGCTKAISETFSDDLYSAERVASLHLRGMKNGQYHLPNPDFLHSLGISAMSGVTPKPRWLLVEVLLAPLMVVVTHVVRVMQDRIVRKYNAQKV